MKAGDLPLVSEWLSKLTNIIKDTVVMGTLEGMSGHRCLTGTGLKPAKAGCIASHLKEMTSDHPCMYAH